MEKRKILFMIHGLPIGGTESALLSMLHRIDYEKNQIYLLVSDGTGERMSEVPRQVHVTVLESKSAMLFNSFVWAVHRRMFIDHPILFLFRMCVSVKANILNRNERIYDPWNDLRGRIPMHENEYDVAIDYDGFCKEYIIDKVQSKKKIAWNHFDYSIFEKNKKIDEKYFKQLNALVSVSETGAETLKKYFPACEQSIKTLYNFMDVELIRKKAEEGCSEPVGMSSKLMLCSVGRLEDQKDFSFAIEVAEYLKGNKQEFVWYIVGEGSERKKLEGLIAQKKLCKEVILLGKKENPFPYIKNCKLYIQTSKYEGLSVAVAEAMALYKPIIVTDVQGLREYTEDGKYGIAVEREPKKMAEAIMGLSDEMRINMENNLMAYDWSGKKAMQVFYELLGE